MGHYEGNVAGGCFERRYDGAVTETMIVCSSSADKVSETLNKNVSVADAVCKAGNRLNEFRRLVEGLGKIDA